MCAARFKSQTNRECVLFVGCQGKFGTSFVNLNGLHFIRNNFYIHFIVNVHNRNTSKYIRMYIVSIVVSLLIQSCPKFRFPCHLMIPLIKCSCLSSQKNNKLFIIEFSFREISFAKNHLYHCNIWMRNTCDALGPV